MKKPRIILYVLGGVFAVVVLGVGVAVYFQSQKASELRDRLNREERQLRAEYNKDIFPSQANVETIQQNFSAVQGFSKALRDELRKGMVQPERAKTPGDFSRLREEMIAQLIADAPSGIGDQKVVKDDAQFGFGRYATGIPAEKDNVSRLLRQLRITDRLVRAMYDSGILTLDQVARDEFEGASAASASSDSGEGRRRGGSRRATRTAELRVTPPVLPPDAPPGLDCQRFAFQFTTREAGLVNVLNKLNEMRPFAVVSSLSFEKQGQDVVFPDEEKEEAQASGRRREAATPAPAAPAVINARPAPRTARLVSGPLRERPIRVNMTVDVYSILPVQSQDSEAREEG